MAGGQQTAPAMLPSRVRGELMMTQDCDASDKAHGRCMCGDVQYTLAGEPLLTALCHCRQCQRQTGSAFSIVAMVPEDQFELTGETRVFTDKGDSGRPVERHFCGNCGSPILSRIEPMPGMVLIKAGTLDDCAGLKPTIEVFCQSALPFPPQMQGTQRFSGSNI